MRSIFKALDGAHLDSALFRARNADVPSQARDSAADAKRLFGGRGIGRRGKSATNGRGDTGRKPGSDGHV